MPDHHATPGTPTTAAGLLDTHILLTSTAKLSIKKHCLYHSNAFFLALSSCFIARKSILQTWSFTLVMTETEGHRRYLNTLYVRSATPTGTKMTGLAGDE